MDFESISFATVGFGFYCFALILRSTGLRHLRFAKVVDLAVPELTTGPNRAWMQGGALIAATVLMSVALWQSLDVDRSAFWLLACLGAMLVCIRLVSFFFSRVSLVVLEIESDPASKLSLAHLCHSPFILGGLILITVVVGIPAALDLVLQSRFRDFQASELIALDAIAAKEGFNAQSYSPRSLLMDGQGLNEEEFFEHTLTPGRRVLVTGRAGIGKSWFLLKTRFDANARSPGRVVVFARAADLDYKHKETWLDHIGYVAFGGLPRGARPVLRGLLENALILIDGLDEVHKANRANAVNEIVALSTEPGLENSILVATTRPVDNQLLEYVAESGFEFAELQTLVADESAQELEEGSARVKRLTQRLAAMLDGNRIDERMLVLFYDNVALADEPVTPRLTTVLFQAFTQEFGFSDRVHDPVTKDVRMPFLSTYRDLEIVSELFLKTLTGQVDIPSGTGAQMHDWLQVRLVEDFVLRRIELNYNSGKVDPGFAQRVLSKIVEECARYLRDYPDAPVFSFEPRRFQGIQGVFEKTTFDKVMLESELMVSDPSTGHFVFDNPALDRHFRNRVTTVKHLVDTVLPY